MREEKTLKKDIGQDWSSVHFDLLTKKIQAFKSTYDIWHQNGEQNKFLNTALFYLMVCTTYKILLDI